MPGVDNRRPGQIVDLTHSEARYLVLKDWIRPVPAVPAPPAPAKPPATRRGRAKKT